MKEVTDPQIQFTSGCPNACQYCHEPKEIKVFSPKIPDQKHIDILDMNLLANPNVMQILKSLPKKKYNLVCGVDFRRLTPDICKLLKEKGFQKIRWAWDYNFGQQRIQKKTYKMLLNAGFRKDQLMVFILGNWKIPYIDCIRKTYLLLSWNVEISPCIYDGGTPKNHNDWLSKRFDNKRFWEYEEVKRFVKHCRKFNHITNFGIDVEW